MYADYGTCDDIWVMGGTRSGWYRVNGADTYCVFQITGNRMLFTRDSSMGRALWDSGIAQWLKHSGIDIAHWVEYHGIIGYLNR